MRHPINPLVDCVFKALLGAECNRTLLIHFLNAIIGNALPGPITETTILNPYNEREFIDDSALPTKPASSCHSHALRLSKYLNSGTDLSA